MTAIRQRSYQAFLQRLAASPEGAQSGAPGFIPASIPASISGWWSAVILTAGSKAQAELYRQQIRYRSERGYLPRNVSWHIVPDPDGRHIGSGGATLRALRILGKPDPAWWRRN